MLVCMRTTLKLDDGLVADAKVVAARRGRTLSQFIEDALRQALAPRDAERHPPVTVPTSPGAALPGVNLDDSAALLELMDEA